MTRLPVLLAALALLLLPSAASAQLVACPDEEDQFNTKVPAFSRIGGSDTFRVINRDDYEEVSDVENFSLTIAAEDGSATTVPVELGPYGNAKLILAVPAAGEAYTATFHWDQGVGSQAACHGSDEWTVPLAPPDATTGDPSQPRLSGTYLVRYKAVNYKGGDDKATWTIKGLCDVFACSGKLTSTSGARGLLRLQGDGSYEYFKRYRKATGWCSVVITRTNRFTGQVLSRRTVTIRPAYRLTRSFLLKVESDEEGRVVSFRGRSETHYGRTPRAKRMECRRQKTYVDTVTGTVVAG